MAQNITLLGASYSDVPSVELPKTGGGTAQFDDTTIASNAASASDITSGKLAFVNGELVTGTASGGGATLITKSITANGTYNASSDNADGYSSVTVNVSGGGGGLEYETGTWTTPTDVLKTSILFSDTHSVAPFYFMVSDETEEYYSTKSSVYNICYYNFHQLFGVAYNVDNNGTYHYGYVYRRWRNSSTGITGGVITLLYPYTDSGYIYNTYPRSWVNETGITAQSSSADYFRAGRIYKWIAVWAPTS